MTDIGGYNVSTQKSKASSEHVGVPTGGGLQECPPAPSPFQAIQSIGVDGLFHAHDGVYEVRINSSTNRSSSFL
jgi:hypothetical protein